MDRRDFMKFAAAGAAAAAVGPALAGLPTTEPAPLIIEGGSSVLVQALAKGRGASFVLQVLDRDRNVIAEQWGVDRHGDGTVVLLHAPVAPNQEYLIRWRPVAGPMPDAMMLNAVALKR